MKPLRRLLPIALTAALLAPFAWPATAQPDMPLSSAATAPIVPSRPPPLRLVCATGPQLGDFCAAKPGARSGSACVCGSKDRARRGRVELR
jgi:hypothetical protein